MCWLHTDGKTENLFLWSANFQDDLRTDLESACENEGGCSPVHVVIEGVAVASRRRGLLQAVDLDVDFVAVGVPQSTTDSRLTSDSSTVKSKYNAEYSAGGDGGDGDDGGNGAGALHVYMPLAGLGVLASLLFAMI